MRTQRRLADHALVMTLPNSLLSTDRKARYQSELNLMGKSLSSVPRVQPVCYWLSIGSIFLLLLAPSASAYAGWASLGDTDLGTRVYVERGTVLSKGNLVTMWILYDFRSMRTVAGKSYFSSKTHGEYDCAHKRHRTLKETGFSSIMGLGQVVYDRTSPAKWAPVTPGSFDQKLWKFACGKP